jgi:MraZ protein
VGLTGEFFNNIDVKGRLSIPAKMRALLQEEFGDSELVVTRTSEALVAYPLSRWEKIKAEVEAMPNGADKDVIYRSRISPAAQSGFDSQGRIAIPASLRSIARLEKEVVIVGLSDKIELWSHVRFVEQMERSEERLRNMTDKLGELGF